MLRFNTSARILDAFAIVGFLGCITAAGFLVTWAQEKPPTNLTFSTKNVIQFPGSIEFKCSEASRVFSASGVPCGDLDHIVKITIHGHFVAPICIEEADKKPRCWNTAEEQK